MSPISGSTRVAAVIGWPVAHSRSPALHNAAYRAVGLDAVYVALEVPPAELAAALAGARALGFLGLNVTVPHKEAALAACVRVDEVARQAGAVNTLVIEDGALTGYNTDVGGLVDALGPELPAGVRGRAVVLGAGGGARAAVLSLLELGFEPVVVARRVERAEPLRALGAAEVRPWSDEGLTVLAGASLLVDATSAALDPQAAVPARIPLERLGPDATVCSLVYHREPTLVAEARARGLRAITGEGMLLHQAARAFTLMTKRTAPLDAMREALRSAA